MLKSKVGFSMLRHPLEEGREEALGLFQKAVVELRKLNMDIITSEEIVDKEIDSLIRSKIYKKEDDVIVDALEALLEKKPQLRQEIAVDLYKNNDISLWRASEIARMNIEEFKNILISKGIRIEVS